MKKLSGLPIFLPLLAAYPVLYLLAWNIREVEWPIVLRPLAVALALVLAALLACQVVYRDWRKASIQAVLFILLFFSYGHLYDFILNSTGIGKPNRLLAAIFAFVFTGTAVFLFRTRRDLRGLVSGLNWIGLFLVGFTLVQLVSYELERDRAGSTPGTLNPAAAAGSPDIYYIILDGYNRADLLAQMGYDNSDFIGFLRSKGFYVADCSRSNYRKTVLSMASALNMDYVYDFIPNDGFGDTDLDPVIASIKDNRVRAELKWLGYTDISFDMGFRWATWWDADLYLPQFNRYTTYFKSATSNPFELMVVRTSALGPLIDRNLAGFEVGENTFASDRGHYERVHYILDKLPELATYPGPKLVYAHLIVPHSPYVFLPDGSFDPRGSLGQAAVEEQLPGSRRGYLNNLEFINNRIKSVIADILEDSEKPPIILLQSDHSLVTDSDDRRFNILNAYHLPGIPEGVLYPTITPVNSFRLIFNHYFDAGLPLLEDKSITSDVGHPYSTIEADVTACP